MISVRVHEIRMILENVAAQTEPAESAIVPNDFVLWRASDATHSPRGLFMRQAGGVFTGANDNACPLSGAEAIDVSSRRAALKSSR